MKQIFSRIKSLTAVAVLLLSASATWLPKLVSASSEAWTGTSSFSTTLGQQVNIEDLTITGTGNDTVYVTIQADSGTLTLGDNTDITVTKSLQHFMQFNGTRSAVNLVLQYLSFNPSESGTTTITATIGTAADEVYFPTNGHIYKLVHPDGDISWADAKTAADASTAGGVNGYLATFNAENESDFLTDWTNGTEYWAGASDSAEEGVWKWADGPENGTNFWNGDNIIGEAVDDNYVRWDNNQPDANTTLEDCMQVFSYGAWNDQNCNFNFGAYLVEYGASEVNPVLPTKTITVDTTVNNQTISTCNQLMELGEDNIFDDITLTDDIDCQGVEVHPLFPDGYHGQVDGGEHTISNFTISDGGSDSGLFGYITEDGSVSNLNLENFNITADEWAGALAGENYGTLSNVHATNVSINTIFEATGGLVGYNSGADANDVSASGTITGTGENSSETGGLFGYFQDGTLSDCHFDGTVNGVYEVGGIVGENEEDITINQCYSTGSVSASVEDAGGIIGEPESDLATLNEVFSTANISAGNSAGGLVGYVNGGLEINNSYATGNVSTDYSGGGLVGYQAADLTITDSYATGLVSDNGEVNESDDFGGLTGTDDGGDYDHAFWDTQTTGQTGCANGSDCNGTAFGMSTAIMKTPANYTTNLDEPWDFETIWQISAIGNYGYPCLQWSEVSCQNPHDTDDDSITNTIEDAAPNNGDANNDGTADSQQSAVASMLDSISGQYAVVETSCGTLSEIGVSAEPNSGHDAAYNYPYGMLGFKVHCAHSGCVPCQGPVFEIHPMCCPSNDGLDATGNTVQITEYFYGDDGTTSLLARKWNSSLKTYVSIPDAVVSHVTIAGHKVLKVQYSIKDGGPLDEDGVADGYITDPSGPGKLVLSAPDTGFGGSY